MRADRYFRLPVRLAALWVLVFCALGTTGAAATTHRVPEQYPAIQLALDAAADDDTILVGPGVWTGAQNHNLNLASLNIVLVSRDGEETTIIDCENDGDGVRFNGLQSRFCVLDGFTIRNAAQFGIYLYGASPTIRHCTVTGCVTGGVLFAGQSAALMESCHIDYNAGFGIQVNDSWPEVGFCSISGNGTGNAYAGAGIQCYSCSPTFSFCTIVGNRAEMKGGGIYCESASPTFETCRITGNRAVNAGGGGVFSATGSAPRFTTCVISRNWGTGGGGVYSTGSTTTLIRTILWGNCATGEGNDAYVVSDDTIRFTCCNVDPAGVMGGGTVDFDGPQVNGDPHFCDMGACWTAPTILGNFQLAGDSPCLAQECGPIGDTTVSGCSETAIQQTTWGRIRGSFR